MDVAKTRKQAESNSSALETNVLSICRDIFKKEGLSGLFVGLKVKASHTVVSSFTFFYWFSFLKTTFEKRFGRLSASSSLLLNAIAGAINMSMTLPLELLTTRQQTQKKDQKRSLLVLAREIYQQRGLVGFWKGYIASLVLVSNPAINFTVFDRLKLNLQLIQRKQQSGNRLKSISMVQAFLLGAIAKAIATIITYPIIRAKILMQASKESKSQSMVQVLRRIGESDGMSGYYKGCDAQLFNTVLKSALLLMTKEQITKYTMRFLYAMRSKRT